MIDNKAVGARLKALRGDKPIEKVCLDNNISYSALTKYEMGIRTPRDELKLKLAQYYGASVESIFFATNAHES